MSTPKAVPDHHDAELTLRLYDLRREAVMRQSREAMMRWLPRGEADVMALTAPDHPDNAAWRQVSSYYEMAYSMARHGIANPDFLAENHGEGLLLFAKVEPWLGALRGHAPHAFRNAEWLVENSQSAKDKFDLFRARIQAQLER